jgi:hypothetical protein
VLAVDASGSVSDALVAEIDARSKALACLFERVSESV